MKVYYIGGSPCSGKSTVAEMISEKYGFFHYKLDDKLNKYIEQAVKDDKPRCKAYLGMTPEQVWMRKPEIQCDDEVYIYREIFEYALKDITKINVPFVITEGAGYLPDLMKKAGVGENEYICIIPTREFQVKKYSEREWVPYVLEGCTDKKAAFENWMERDALFAIYAAETADKNGYKTILMDGMSIPSEMLNIVEKVFEL